MGCDLLSIYRIVLFSIEFKMKSLEEISSNMWVHLNLFRSLWMWIKIGESDKVNRHLSKIRFGRLPATDVHTLCKKSILCCVSANTHEYINGVCHVICATLWSKPSAQFMLSYCQSKFTSCICLDENALHSITNQWWMRMIQNGLIY